MVRSQCLNIQIKKFIKKLFIRFHRKHYIYWYLLISLTLLSCEEEVEDANFFNNDTLILISSTISPQDEILSVSVSKSSNALFDPAENQNQASITNASVKLSNLNGNSISLLYDSFDQVYQVPSSSFEILAGERYFLEVTVGSSTFTASCKIPVKKINNIEYQLLEAPNQDGNIKEALEVSFEDIQDEQNYYIIGARLQDTFSRISLDFGFQRFASDVSRDKTAIRALGFGLRDFPVTTITMQVAHVEEVLYQSLFSVYSNRVNENNPFYEINIPPNTIQGEGVFGIFAGYQLTERSIQINLEN